MTLLGYKVNLGGARKDSRLAPVLHYSLMLSPRLNCRGQRAGKGSVGGVVQPMWHRWFVKGIPERSECQRVSECQRTAKWFISFAPAFSDVHNRVLGL